MQLIKKEKDIQEWSIEQRINIKLPITQDRTPIEIICLQQQIFFHQLSHPLCQMLLVDYIQEAKLKRQILIRKQKELLVLLGNLIKTLD